MQDFDTQTIKLTERAARQLAKIQAEQKSPEKPYLRVGVKGGGCSGLSYILDFDTKTEKDIEMNLDGIDLIVDKRHALYLEGTVLDFRDGLDARGFTFENPRATSTCGCGSSFSA